MRRIDLVLRRPLAALVATTVLLIGTGLAPALVAAADDQETAIGKQVEAQLEKKGEILRSSPYYATLQPIARRIAAVADPQYEHPFHFILVHEAQPNAFAVPGGNVYVTDSLMKFVQNREELAGVLCHETSHDIHHDVVNNMRKDQTLGIAATALGILIGNAGNGIPGMAINYAANIQALTYSRKVEAAADAKGALTCAQAGFNPWGMVWLFRQFEKADTGGSMEMLSDHPTNAHRISDLENLFRSDPRTFGRFSSNIATATALPGVRATTSVRSLPPPAARREPARPRVIRTPGPHDPEPTFP